MAIYGVVKARLKVLDAQSRKISSANTAREILREAEELYKLCKETRNTHKGGLVALGVTTGVAAAATAGIAAVVCVGAGCYSIYVDAKWEKLKDLAKEVGRRAAKKAGRAFNKKSSGKWALVQGALAGIVDNAGS